MNRQIARSESDLSATSAVESPGKTDKQVDLKASFGVPDSEAVVDDFICALKRSILYQGRLYIYDHHACFESHLFGRQKLVTISLKDVTAIKKRKHFGFPNSVEITHRGKIDNFTSFLKRDDAYRVLCYAWEKSSPDAKVQQSSGSSVSLSRDSTTADSKKVLGSRHLAKIIARPLSGESWKKTDDSSIGEDLSGESDPKEPETDDIRVPSATSASAVEVAEPPLKPQYSQYHSDSDDENASEIDGQDEVENWQPINEPPPAVTSDMNKLIDEEIDVPVRTFYKEFLSDDSQFFISWHQSRGDTKVQLSEWRKHNLGYVRDLTFITPLKQKIGPSKCLCTQTQRTRLHPDDHLVFNTSQIMDIPYGDYFSVNTQWDITPVNNNRGCKVTIHLAIPFSKKTMFKSTIQSNTKQLMTTGYQDWIKTARKWLEDPIPVGGTGFVDPQPPESCFAGGGGAGESAGDDDGPTHLSRAQSLAVRLSRDRLSASRQMNQDPQSSAFAHQASQHDHGTGLGKRVSFELPANQSYQETTGWLGRLNSSPVLLVLAFLLLLQVFYMCFWWLGYVEAGILGYRLGGSRSLLLEDHERAFATVRQDLLVVQQQIQHMTSLIVDLQQQIVQLHHLLHQNPT